MKKTVSKNNRRNRLFFEIIPVALLFAVGIIYYSAQQIKTDTSCGCGVVTADSDGEFEPTNQIAVFNNKPVTTQYAYTSDYLVDNNVISNGFVLGTSNDDRWIEIDLSEQKLYARNGANIDYEFLVSTGKWAPTPTGQYRIWGKSKNTYYYLPNVPYTQYFYKGYGIHGAYWHNNFGTPMSHGCVNMAIPDAEKIFYWTSPVVPDDKKTIYASKDNVGTRVVIHE